MIANNDSSPTPVNSTLISLLVRCIVSTSPPANICSSILSYPFVVIKDQRSMLLLPKSLLFLCIVSYSSSSITPRQGEKLVDSVVEALTAVKLDDAHILTALNELGPKAAKLFKTLVPLGSLALQTFATKLHSDEYKILKDLKNRTQPVWDDNDDIVVVSAGALGLHELLKQYKEKVTDQIRKLNEYSDKYLDPEANRDASFIKQFNDLCESGESSTFGFVENTVSISKYNLISEPIRKILLKEPLNPFPNEYENYQEAAKHLFDELKVKDLIDSAIDENSKCLLKQMVTMANFRYSAIQYFGYQLESQLILLSKVASMCGSILYKDDAEGLETYEERITSHVARIATHVSQYLNNSLISAWPYTHDGILQEMIMTYVPNREEAEIRDLKIAANTARARLEHIGLPINVYETLIVQAGENNYESFFEGTGSNCFFNKQYKGQLNLATDLQVIANSLKTKIGKDILNKFSGWAIIRESNHTKCPDIKLWSSPYNSVALESITALSYTNKRSFTEDSEEFRFFFFM
ncbi:unnamed protein product [Caenorhabditis nigoni]